MINHEHIIIVLKSLYPEYIDQIESLDFEIKFMDNIIKFMVDEFIFIQVNFSSNEDRFMYIFEKLIIHTYDENRYYNENRYIPKSEFNKHLRNYKLSKIKK